MRDVRPIGFDNALLIVVTSLFILVIVSEVPDRKGFPGNDVPVRIFRDTDDFFVPVISLGRIDRLHVGNQLARRNVSAVRCRLRKGISSGNRKIPARIGQRIGNIVRRTAVDICIVVAGTFRLDSQIILQVNRLCSDLIGRAVQIVLD